MQKSHSFETRFILQFTNNFDSVFSLKHKPKGNQMSYETAPSELCPKGTNHLVEWFDHVHLEGKCYALVPVELAEAIWAYLNTHVDVDGKYNADIDALHSELDSLKHGE